jgi:hypothetical protein
MAQKEAFSDLLAAGQREKHVDEGKCEVVVAHELPPGGLTRPCRGLMHRPSRTGFEISVCLSRACLGKMIV